MPSVRDLHVLCDQLYVDHKSWTHTSVSAQHAVVMTLAHLRCDFPVSTLAQLLGIPQSTADAVHRHVIDDLATFARNYVVLPRREILRTMQSKKKGFEDVTIIGDTTYVFTTKP